MRASNLVMGLSWAGLAVPGWLIPEVVLGSRPGSDIKGFHKLGCEVYEAMGTWKLKARVSTGAKYY